MVRVVGLSVAVLVVERLKSGMLKACTCPESSLITNRVCCLGGLGAS